MPRKLIKNTTIPIEVQRQLQKLEGWAQQDETSIAGLTGGATAGGAGSPAFGSQQANLLQSLGATALQMVTPAPLHFNYPGKPGQVAVDPAGNFYWVYAPSRWARIGSGGWSNSF